MQIPGLLWDGCDLISLAACGQAEEVLQSLNCPNYVVREVRLNEALYLRPLPEDDPQVNTTFNLEPLLASGLLQDVDMTEEEKTRFVAFASQVDDGEAQTAAVAVQRGWWVATDDREAIRLLKSLSPPIPALTTMHWLKMWADNTNAAHDVIARALYFVRWKARFKPKRTQENAAWYDWWEACLPTELAQIGTSP